MKNTGDRYMEGVAISASVKKSLVTLLKAAQKAVNKGEVTKLEQISEQAIKETIVLQDKDLLILAVIIFATAKLIKRLGIDTEYPADLRNFLAAAQFSLENDEFDDYREKIIKTQDFIRTTDQNYRQYVERVMEAAEIKKGSSLYERGISMAESAEMLGIGQWELMSYVGKTQIHDETADFTGVGERIRYARNLFRK